MPDRELWVFRGNFIYDLNKLTAQYLDSEDGVEVVILECDSGRVGPLTQGMVARLHDIAESNQAFDDAEVRYDLREIASAIQRVLQEAEGND